jgi:hypothetical protein
MGTRASAVLPAVPRPGTTREHPAEHGSAAPDPQLVPARAHRPDSRPPPADALPATGWFTFDDVLGYPPFPPEPVYPAVWIAAVLRSWEDRFGARLLNIGPGAEIRLLVQRPPRSPEAARRVAAEHWAFADECDGCGPGDITEITAALLNQPALWQFWWD